MRSLVVLSAVRDGCVCACMHGGWEGTDNSFNLVTEF